jgi:hypothetical protein
MVNTQQADTKRQRLVAALEHREADRVPNHQGLGNRLIMEKGPGPESGAIACRQRLGGMLSYYYRQAA